jgi:hypothetical protein
MRRKVLLLTALAVAAVAAIGGLAATAFGPEDGSVAKPTGKETRIRIEPQKDSVACSGDKQAVDVFLDDLQARPSALAAFQLTLLYDPSILRVEKPEDAQMNPALASAQTAGGTRNFIPAPVTIDNLEGYVFMGAVGIPEGVHEGVREGEFDPAAQGLDPVARGEPILLFTVNFQTVGEGTSALSVSRPEEGPQKPWAPELEVLDYAGQPYAPVVVTDSSLTVTAGDCAPAPAVTARPTQVLPTPFPTRTPVIVPTPQQVTPVPAAEGGRPDCPEGWNAYRDPDDHFSFCFPPGLSVVTSRVADPELGGVSVNLGVPVSGSEPSAPNRVLMALGWGVDPVFNPALDLVELCPVAPLLRRQETSVPVEIQIGGRKAVGCAATGADDISGPPVNVLLVQIPVSAAEGPDEGYVKLKMSIIGPDIGPVEAQGRAILDTLVVVER